MGKLRLIKIRCLAEAPTTSGRIEIQTQAHEHSTLLRPREKLEEAQLGFQRVGQGTRIVQSKKGGSSARGKSPGPAL